MQASLYWGGLAAAASFVSLFPIRVLLRRAGIVDRPNARSSHRLPTVRGGGLAIVAVIALCLALLCLTTIEVGGADVRRFKHFDWTKIDRQVVALLITFVVLAAVSFADDLKGLPARVRFAVHLACAMAVDAALLTSNGEAVTAASPTVAAVSAIWIIGYTNAFNFMDGIDGIAGMQGLTTSLGMAAVANALGLPWSHPTLIVSLVVSGTAFGFLPHNFPKARVFMGDVGSAPLGFLLSALAFWIAMATSWWVLFWLGLLHANFVLDTGITMTRRAAHGENVWQAHREHFYQRLVRAGQSHTRVTLTEGALQVVVAAMVVAGTNSNPGVRVAVGAAVVAIWLSYFAYAERVFVRATRASQTLKADTLTR